MYCKLHKKYYTEHFFILFLNISLEALQNNFFCWYFFISCFYLLIHLLVNLSLSWCDHLLVNLSAHILAYLIVHLFYFYFYIYVNIYLFIYLLTYLFTYLFIYLFIFLCIHLFIYLSIHLLIYSFLPSLGQHYSVEKKDQKVELTPAGFKYAEQIVGKYIRYIIEYTGLSFSPYFFLHFYLLCLSIIFSSLTHTLFLSP